MSALKRNLVVGIAASMMLTACLAFSNQHASGSRSDGVNSIPAPWFDNMEGGAGSWYAVNNNPTTAWQLGNPVSFGPGSANSPTNCRGTNLLTNYGDSADSILSAPAINTTSMPNIILTFYTWLKSEDYWDAGWVEVSSDNATWGNPSPAKGPAYAATAWGVSGYTGLQGAWSLAEFDLGAWSGPNLWVRFHFRSDSSTNMEGWYLDDVYIGPPQRDVNMAPGFHNGYGPANSKVDHIVQISNGGTLGETYDLMSYLPNTFSGAWTKSGVVLNRGGTYDLNHAAAPCVIKDGGTYKMWYAGDDSSGVFRILYATSPDGITWTKQGIAIDYGGTYANVYVTAPCVVKTTPTDYVMWYTGWDGTTQRILYANSSNGINWKKQGLALDVGGAGESAQVSFSWVIREGSNSYKMWYSGYESASQLFMATSTNGKTWTKRGLVLPYGGSTYETGGIYGCSVIRDGPTYRMWYTGKNSHTWIMKATSSDGFAWTKGGLALSYGSYGQEADAVLEPSVMIDGNVGKMWYMGVDWTPTNTGAIMYATTPYSSLSPWTMVFRNRIDTATITSISINASTTDSFIARVTVPSTAVAGNYWNHTVMAIGQNNTTIRDSVTVNTTCQTIVYVAFDIPVVAGWNLIFMPLLGPGAMPAVLTDQTGGAVWTRAMWYNPSTPADPWKQYNTGWNSALNDLTLVDNTKGIWLYVTVVGDGILDVGGTGYTAPTSTAVSLRAGWNLVGFPSDDTAYTVAMLKAACPTVSIVEHFDGAQTYLTSAMADTAAFAPGKGYWIYSTADAVWNKAY